MTIAALSEAVKPKLKPQSIQEQLDVLRTRMYAALDQIADAAGAWRCEYCGEYTLEDITVANYSDEMGVEYVTHCRSCLP
jgi:hypothetical protein